MAQGSNVKQPTDWTQSLPGIDFTLAESLKEAGYATAHIGKWHLGASPSTHGFDSNVGGSSIAGPDAAGGYFAGADGGWTNMPGLGPGQFPADKYLGDALADAAENFIQQNASTPFFLSYWDYLVHIGLEAPADLVTKYQTKINTLQGMGVDLKGHTNATYAAMIEKMDQSLGRLLDRLEDPNDDGNMSDSIRDNTIFVFTSDNGGLWAPGSIEGAPTRTLPLREGKGSIYEGGIRVPLMVSWTGEDDWAQGSFSASPTSTYDLYPTVVDLAGLDDMVGVPINANMDGISWRNALEGSALVRDQLFWHFPHRSNQNQGSGQVNGGSFVSAILDGDWKLIFFYDDRHYELYNVAMDIGETTNLLSENSAQAMRLTDT
jgi:arylsulfatase A-like enzyme